MPPFTAHVGLLDKKYAALKPTFRLGKESLRDYFQAFSSANGHPDIILSLALDSTIVFGKAPGPVISTQLHQALRALTRNPDPPRPVRNLGILLADTYAPFPSAFGIMFDRGFRTDDDKQAPEPAYLVPREGCAVFLGAISKLRPTVEATDAELTYTAIHELGHVFNLGHANGDRTFMARSLEKSARPSAFWNFSEDHARSLSTCSTSSFVHPGGDAYWDDDAQNRAGESSEAQAGLRLAVRTVSRPVWNFEPFELDIKLSLARDASSQRQVPHEVDPGYSRFKIWIESSDGLRAYRSPRLYCGPQKRVTITRGRPFLRDVSVFAQSGGYTFRRPGMYRLWAEFEVDRSILRSKVRQIEIKPFDRDATKFAQMRQPKHARILYHRSASPRSHALKDLRELVLRAPRSVVTGNVAYAVGRTYEQLTRKARSSEYRATLKRAAEAYLARAHDHDNLGDHARRKAASLLDELKCL